VPEPTFNQRVARLQAKIRGAQERLQRLEGELQAFLREEEATLDPHNRCWAREPLTEEEEQYAEWHRQMAANFG
jgi:uncharacterized protein YukE